MFEGLRRIAGNGIEAPSTLSSIGVGGKVAANTLIRAARFNDDLALTTRTADVREVSPPGTVSCADQASRTFFLSI